MKLTFEMKPDGTVSYDVEVDPGDTGQMGNIGIGQWQWMVARALEGVVPTPEYPGQEQGYDNGRDRLPAATDAGESSGEARSVRP